jgi:class 3 adenylate cyclase
MMSVSLTSPERSTGTGETDDAVVRPLVRRQHPEQRPILELAPPPIEIRPSFANVRSMMRAVSRFFDSTPTPRSRQFAAIAFVDIADSTNQLHHHGDRAWARVLAGFHHECDRTIDEHGGRMLKTMGDGLLATFETASEAIEALRAIRTAADERRLAVRGAIHAAEVEFIGDDVAGVGVHVAARVEALTAPGELWVTSTVHDVIAGSRVALEDRGVHDLKGFDEPWRLFAVSA